ncbi:DUF2203 domain-containing protein [Fimbriiglobus ruber]|uniref:DUF2203 family protein n=1 Tax=Fimbriiglobus ruber TaxID=1908690 RepID=A0A225DF99_9BACT|nr:DUF2203 family protein [Fimbriiglobus ruber]OWK38324.1 hypothetical protein FRUB_07444 [Fimbriiglobus ruber]
MSSSPNRASNPTGKPRRKDVTVDLSTARQMLPLVRSIVADIVTSRQHLNRFATEQELLDDNRRALDWSGRRRRYALHDELAQVEKNLTTAVSELDSLGLLLVDPDAGTVDFPTKINGRPAAFSWQLGEDGVAHWRYNGEQQRRPIPADWQQGAPLRARSDH